MSYALVIGASENPERYSYKAINALKAHNIPTLAIGTKKGQIFDVPIHSSISEIDQSLTNDIDTITLYINPLIQRDYYDQLMQLEPKRMIFNPGTENPEFYALLNEKGIQYQEACTLVLLATNQY